MATEYGQQTDRPGVEQLPPQACCGSARLEDELIYLLNKSLLLIDGHRRTGLLVYLQVASSLRQECRHVSFSCLKPWKSLQSPRLSRQALRGLGTPPHDRNPENLDRSQVLALYVYTCYCLYRALLETGKHP